MRRIVVALVALLLVAGCSRPKAGVDEVLATASATPSATVTRTAPAATPTPTETLTPTSTPSPTSTPTPTAQPIAVSGDPRDWQVAEPVPQPGAPCGYVDFFDFPVNPPDALSVARGSGDFGAYRRRYELYHAGEDWWPRRGQSSFGEPVFAIGHGLVTLAAPDGWGRDQGVLIVQHAFADGSQLLSFYGHLDPPSVTLKAGMCVRRGELVGDIGRPRTTPHLHFEVRTHMPYETGGGYWPEDPTLAGWQPPSDTIWYSRMVASPAFLWARRPTEPEMIVLGQLADRALLAIVDERLVAVNWQDGRLLWEEQSDKRRVGAIMDARQPVLYVTNRSGFVEALPLDFLLTPPDEGPPTAPEPLWRSATRYLSSSTLLPLPNGGLVIANWHQTTALSPEGRLLWTDESVARSFDWVLTENELIVAANDSDPALWSVRGAGMIRWPASGGGSLALAQDRVYFYGEEGVFELDLDMQATRMLYSLSPRFFGPGDLLVLPGGALLVVHPDLDDSRLMVLEQDGTLRWERSLDRAVAGPVTLLSDGQRVYLLGQEPPEAGQTLALYHVDPQAAELVLLFRGGNRSSYRLDHHAWIGPNGNILLEVGGGSPVLLDPARVLE